MFWYCIRSLFRTMHSIVVFHKWFNHKFVPQITFKWWIPSNLNKKTLWESLTYFKWIIFKIDEIDNGKSFEVFLKDQGMNRNDFLVAIKGVNINANWWSSYTINHKQYN